MMSMRALECLVTIVDQGSLQFLTLRVRQCSFEVVVEFFWGHIGAADEAKLCAGLVQRRARAILAECD